MAKSLSGLLPVLKVKMNNKRCDIIYGPKKDKKRQWRWWNSSYLFDDDVDDDPNPLILPIIFADRIPWLFLTSPLAEQGLGTTGLWYSNVNFKWRHSYWHNLFLHRHFSPEWNNPKIICLMLVFIEHFKKLENFVFIKSLYLILFGKLQNRVRAELIRILDSWFVSF